MTPREYEKHLKKGLKQAQGTMANVFHCMTPDCQGFATFDDAVNVFLCRLCQAENCLTCQVRRLFLYEFTILYILYIKSVLQGLK